MDVPARQRDVRRVHVVLLRTGPSPGVWLHLGLRTTRDLSASPFTVPRVARKYERSIPDIQDIDVLDWQLIERTGQLFEQYTREDGDLRFYATDSRGEYTEDTFSAFRAGVEAQDEVPQSVMVTAHRDDDTMLHFQVWFGLGEFTRGAVFKSTNEADVSHVAERCTVLFRQANERHIAAKQQATDAARHKTEASAAAAGAAAPPSTNRQSGYRHFLYNPWVVTVGGSLVVAGIVAAIVALT